MKKHLMVLISFMVLFNACSKNKVPSEEKSVQVEKKDIEKNKYQSDKTEEKSSWGNAPDFTLITTKGNTLTLSQFKKKVIILDFWATWCPPCKAEIPDFVTLQNDYKEQLVIVGICLDEGDLANVKKFIEEMNIQYPIVMGNSDVVRDYGEIRGIPTTIIIDRKGDIKEKIVGYRPKNFFESKIKQYGKFN